ncbi:MAG: hypothetical protein KKB50_16955 [Planctomycetes bacterium]|nr:hypothetical protein [Planctomycetota bacterium]
MSRVLAIARLAFWEGIRMRIVLVFIIVLVFVVLRLPFALHGDETLAGRLQTFLAYSLGALSLFLSLATVFLSCATLANEIKSNSIHMVVTKPVSRFEILLGKWIGVNLLNILLVVLCGLTIYGLANFIRSRPEQFRRDRVKVNEVVWTARAAATPVPPDFEALAREHVEQRIANGAIAPEQKLPAIAERIKEERNLWLTVKPQTYNLYEFENLVPPKRADEVIQVRFKARGIPTPPNEILHVLWEFIDPETKSTLMRRGPFLTKERSGDMHQFLANAEPVIKNGKAALLVANPANPASRVTLSFDNQDSLQLLYRVGGFEANFVKNLVLIVLRLSFLSAMGLLFSTFVSFPIACMCAFSTYLVGLGWNWWWESIGGNIVIRIDRIDPYGAWGPVIRFFLEPILYVFPNFIRYDGTAQLVNGEYLSYTLLGQCVLQTLVFGGVLLLLGGWLIFRRREIAEVTV